MNELDQFFSNLAILRKIIDSEESQIAVIAEKLRAERGYKQLVAVFEQAFPGYTIISN